MLPLCETIASGPTVTSSFSSTALTVSMQPGSLLMRPMQLGPITRTPPARAIARISSCLRRPSGPVSAKPSL